MTSRHGSLFGVVGRFGYMPISPCIAALRTHVGNDVHITLDTDELLEVAWFDAPAISTLPRHHWIDRILDDCSG